MLISFFGAAAALAMVAGRFGAAGGGDIDLEGLFRELYGPVVGYFMKKGIGQARSEELAQETFLRALSGTGFRGESKPSTWIFTIATNLWRNYLRDQDTDKRRGEEVSIDGEAPLELPAKRDGALDGLVDEERRRLVARAIEDLPPRMRQCVQLRVYQGRSFRDVAELLGISESGAKSQVSLARGKLRRALGESYPELSPALGGED